MSHGEKNFLIGLVCLMIGLLFGMTGMSFVRQRETLCQAEKQLAQYNEQQVRAELTNREKELELCKGSIARQ